MALNTSRTEIIAYRRELVARYRVRGLTVREIVDCLACDGLVNPTTGRAFSLGAVHSDIAALDEQWRRAAEATTAEHKARLLAHLQEVQRVAWAKADLNVVLKAMKLEGDLLGVWEPTFGSGARPLPLDSRPAAASPVAALAGEPQSALDEALRRATPRQRAELAEAVQAVEAARSRLAGVFRSIDQDVDQPLQVPVAALPAPAETVDQVDRPET